MRLSIAFALLASAAAQAEDVDWFPERVAQAERVEVSPEGREYVKRFIAEVDRKPEQFMTACFPPSPSMQNDGFTLVADVQADGSLANVEVRPANEKTLCYSRKFSEMKVPVPPEKFHEGGLPIAIETSFR